MFLAKWRDAINIARQGPGSHPYFPALRGPGAPPNKQKGRPGRAVILSASGIRYIVLRFFRHGTEGKGPSAAASEPAAVLRKHGGDRKSEQLREEQDQGVNSHLKRRRPVLVGSGAF